MTGSPTDALPRTVYVKVSTEILAELADWSEPLHVRIEREIDDSFVMVFKRPETDREINDWGRLG